jgi:hypothetical protein
MVDPLRQAIARIDTGDLKGGQGLLLELVGREPEIEAAWLWLAASTDRLNVRRYYLYRAIQINPHNTLAQQTLADDSLSRSWLAEQLSSLRSLEIQDRRSSESENAEVTFPRNARAPIGEMKDQNASQ